ncbi:MAG: ClC family H(+)/Cl(-) exchange transporter [Candidatus Cloacimonadales bacterium]|jgi:H+/Cl- antiporter ClcA|nr:ClC family H(+)/Cl(-) exchange transporter [Candidatus Cloacimonadales bacterium]
MKNNILNTIRHWQDIKMKLVFESILVGLITGIVVVAYRIMLDFAGKLSTTAYRYMKSHYWLIPIWFLLLILIAIYVKYRTKRVPMISGSGIPQVEGELLGHIDMSWWKTLFNKFTNGFLMIAAGLSLGREGPSVQMGALIGKGVSRIFKRVRIEEKYLISSGAGAGLSGAFSAPLSGIVFVLEEVHKNFSPLVLLPTTVACITADFFNKVIFGFDPVFNLSVLEILPLKYYGSILLLGVIIGISGVYFNKSLIFSLNYYKKMKFIPEPFKMVIPVLIAGALGFFLPDILGGGHHLVIDLVHQSTALKFLLILLVGKFLFTMISYGSGAPGGIFLPLLVIGALIGNVYGYLITSATGIDSVYINNFIVLAMAGYFTAIVKAPITGSLLITEMTGSFSHLLSLSVVSITAYLTADLLKSDAIYETLLARFIKENKKNIIEESNQKVIIEVAVRMGSHIDQKQIMDIQWPKSCLLV